MFYCEECARINEYPKSMTQSYGVCELCGVHRLCNDVPSSRLPQPKTIIEVVEEQLRLATIKSNVLIIDGVVVKNRYGREGDNKSYSYIYKNVGSYRVIHHNESAGLLMLESTNRINNAKTDFETMQQMVREKKDITTTIDFTGGKFNKKGCEITLGVDIDTYHKISKSFGLGKNDYYVVAYVINRKEFDEIQNNK